MSKYDDYIQPEEDSEMLIYEEWVRYVIEQEESHPKIEDRYW
jgi:hypothetical protein